MTNHIHLLVETLNHSPTLFIQHAHSQYAQYFNRQYEQIGHLFQGRFQSLTIDSPEYFHQAGSYIHRNPLKANLQKEAHNPLWSSYPFYIEPDKQPKSWQNIIPITTDRLLEYYNRPGGMDYRLFIETPFLAAADGAGGFPTPASDASSHPFDTPFLTS
jgi:hypothetical protein